MRQEQSRLFLIGEFNTALAMAPGQQQLHSMLRSEIVPERIGWFRAAPGPLALIVDDATDEFFHRNADKTRFALHPCLVSRVDILHGIGGTHEAKPVAAIVIVWRAWRQQDLLSIRPDSSLALLRHPW